MTPERYQQLEDLCHQALGKPAAERAAFVAVACAGDEPLRRELESLLASADRAGSFLEQPPDEVAAAIMRVEEQPAGRRLAHYELRSRLGVGGMGEVFLAEDLRLGRQVALKLLPEDSASDSERRGRLVREAKAASTLSHPNVAHIYEIAEADGVRFIAMEYVPGRTLGALLRERRLTPAETVAIAVQVADALEEAHAKGVVHRDIKPSNIMVTPRGLVKVLDFGVAKILAPGAKPAVDGFSTGLGTQPGSLIGTSEYMSPEQALGLEVDPRSDVFSFGSMLYQMVAGRLPFTGRTAGEILDRVIHAEPEPVVRSNPAAPAGLARIVDRCMSKDRDRRYPSGKELAEDLRALASSPDTGVAKERQWFPRRAAAAAAAAAILALGVVASVALFRRAFVPTAPAAAPPATKLHVRLAVLPFENFSAGPDREYLADALTEETIAALGQLEPDRLSVIGRTSVMSYKRTTKTLATIGRELDADYVVESSIRFEANRVRVTSQLIHASDQVQLWSASYDSEPSSMLAFQRELGTTIAEQIRLRLSPERLEALSRRQTRNPQAYDLYLRGRHFWNQLTPSTNQQAVEAFSHATEMDPHYALAWSGLADAWAASPMNGDAPPQAAWALARNAAAQAMRSEPSLAESLASLAFVEFWFGWNWQDAEALYRKAIALDPSYAFAHRMLGILLGHAGRRAEAEAEMKRARELDPLNSIQHALSAQVAFVGRDNAAALDFARQAIVVDPHFWIGQFQLAQAYEQTGEVALALLATDEAGRLSGGNSKASSLRGYILAKQGKIAEARDVLKKLEARSRERFVPPYAMALVHEGLGEHDAALKWLERSVAVRDVHLVSLPVDPKWDALRANPRLGKLLRRCGLPDALTYAPPVRR